MEQANRWKTFGMAMMIVGLLLILLGQYIQRVVDCPGTMPADMVSIK